MNHAKASPSHRDWGGDRSYSCGHRVVDARPCHYGCHIHLMPAGAERARVISGGTARAIKASREYWRELWRGYVVYKKRRK